MSIITSSDEIEQRYAINPHNGLYLPPSYQQYHQVEIGSGRAGAVIEKFYMRTLDIFSSVHNDTLTTIQGFLSTISTEKQIKLRIRNKFDPNKGEKSAEFTIKEKRNHPNFKIYREHNINIDTDLATALIEHIATEHKISDTLSEFGVRKHRYNVPGPDGKLWDIDVLQGLNAGLIIGEIEVDSLNTNIQLPTWATMQVNGKGEFRFLGTKELQKTTWTKISQDTKRLYLRALGGK